MKEKEETRKNMMMIGENNYYYEHQVSTQNEGGGGGGDGLTLKKGPWTAAEDVVLEEYVKTHGEGNWNAVQKNTGLARCGKSCRLRWANHLRPNLKKGAFSAEEERIIVEFHAIMGNKWARMATRLPGRTDNEIKNYWNTRVKRRQRQGLPLYPPEIESLYLNTSPSTPPLSRPSPSGHVSPHFSNAYFPTTSPHKRFRYDQGHEKNNDGSSFVLPFSSFNHNLFNPQRYSNSFSLESSRIFQSHFNPGQFVSTTRFHYPLKNELPSNQSFTQNGNNSEVTLDHRRNDDDNSNRHCSSLNFSGNGLLEDMLREAQALTDNNETMASRSCLVGSTSSSEGLNSGLNGKEETKEQIMKTKDEPMSVHEWFIGNGEGSIGQSSAVKDDNLGLEFQLHDQIASLFSVDTVLDGHDRFLSCRSWDHNFSGIC